MKDIEKQFIQATKHIMLGTKQKALMREQLVSYMEHKPIRSHTKEAPQSEPTPLFTFFRSHHYSGAVAVALLATVSTFGVSSAADDALPGDLLYPVKVNVNEEIKTAFLGSEEKELLWESERAELRLKEAGQLASEGRLDTKKQESVSKLLAEHTASVNEKVHAMEESDPAFAVEVSTDLEAALGAHEVVLARLIVEQEEGGAEEGGRDLVEQVRTAAKETGKAREGAEQILAADEEIVVAEVPPTDGEPSSEEQIEQPTDTKLKTESANMRERAVYRAQERATMSLARARELTMALDQESTLAQQAMSQISAGETLMGEGTAALSAHELGTAYGLYRKADALFQKVARLLEALNLFSINVLHDTVAEEMPDTEVQDTALVTSTDGLNTESVEEDVPNIYTMRQEVEDILTETRSILLTTYGFDEDVVIQANSLMKGAMAHIMRGDIALVLKDEADAVKLFRSARTQAERAHELVSREARELGVVNVVVPDTATESETLPVFALTHRFENGTHVWVGTIDMPTPCAVLETGALVAESYPEQITLTLNITEPVDAICTQVIDVRSFEIRAGASVDATLRSVQVNGVDRAWSVVQS